MFYKPPLKEEVAALAAGGVFIWKKL